MTDLQRVCGALVLLAALPMSALANDTLVTLGAGGLIPLASSDVAMESEDLAVSLDRITITYTFRNKTTQDIVSSVAFPLPTLEGDDVENVPMHVPSHDERNFVGFRVDQDGRPVTVQVMTQAFHDNHDVTDSLRALNLPLSVLDKSLAAKLGQLDPARQRSLESAGLIECDPSGNGSRRCWARWSTRTGFYWKQRFPAGSAVHLHQTYRPFIGGSYIPANYSGARTIRSYCGGPQTLEAIRDYKRRHPERKDILLFANELEYILTTANNWNGPIGNFHLTVAAASPEDIVVTCMPGLRRVSPIRYEFTGANFRPAGELKLMVLTTQRPLP